MVISTAKRFIIIYKARKKIAFLYILHDRLVNIELTPISKSVSISLLHTARTWSYELMTNTTTSLCTRNRYTGKVENDWGFIGSCVCIVYIRIYHESLFNSPYHNTLSSGFFYLWKVLCVKLKVIIYTMWKQK